MTDQHVIKSYVWHDGECFFVSTIERDSSAVGGPMRYNETMVWPYDWDKRTRADSFVYQSSDFAGSIAEHVRVCQSIFDAGIEVTKETEAK